MRNIWLTGGVLAVAGAFGGGFAGDLLRQPLQTIPSQVSVRVSRLFSLAPVVAQSVAIPLAPPENAAAPPDVCADVLNVVKSNFYSNSRDVPDETRLTYAAIDGMLAAIKDPYTVFFTPAQYQEISDENEGNFVGIGTRLDVNTNKQIVVVETIDGSPAQKAGLLSGDILMAIGGKSVSGKNMEAASDLIRGSEHSKITVTVSRKNRFLTFAMRRGVVHTPIVHFRMEDPAQKIGYIALLQFNEQADAQFDAALAKLEKQEMRGLVFDLRDNPGGLLNIAQDVASRFLDKGPVVWVKEKNGQISSMDVEMNKHRSALHKGAYPVVVLVNGGSASASEIVAGAIQDAHAGTLLGTTTYGKGLVQTIIPLADDSAVKITTQHYFTRDKHDINKKRDASGKQISGGILPDLVLASDEKAEAAQTEALRRDPQNWAASDKYDNQLQKALSLVSEKLSAKP